MCVYVLYLDKWVDRQIDALSPIAFAFQLFVFLQMEFVRSLKKALGCIKPVLLQKYVQSCAPGAAFLWDDSTCS